MRKKLVIGCITLVALLIGISWYVFTTNYIERTNPLAQNALEQRNYQVFARTALQNDLAVEERTWHGNPQAPIYVLVVLDIQNPVSEETLTVLRENTAERVENNIVKIAVKYYITDEDYTETKDTFIYAAAARCLENDASWIEAFQALIRGEKTPETVRELVGEEAFAACSEARALVEDVFHTRTQRTIAPSILVGTNTRAMTALYGAPNAEDLEQAIREYEIRFGI